DRLQKCRRGHLLTERSVIVLHATTRSRNAVFIGRRGPSPVSALLESYAGGAWFRASDEGKALLDASTGEEVARISSTGLDLSAMVDRARTVGGPAIRSLTFHERAGILKAVAKHLGEDKEALYALSARAGATLRDSQVDIDGGIGTTFSYASKGTRELPNDTVILDGATEQLGRTGVFVGQHVDTSRPGVAV